MIIVEGHDNHGGMPLKKKAPPLRVGQLDATGVCLGSGLTDYLTLSATARTVPLDEVALSAVVPVGSGTTA